MQVTATCRPTTPLAAAAAAARPAAGGSAGPRRPAPLVPLARPSSPLLAGRRHPARRQLLTARRAMAEDDDPYKVLGVAADADSDAIARAYNRKKFEVRGDDAAAARLEAAHSAVVMAALAARIQGGAAVADPLARYADRSALFPWRPRRADADRQTQLVSAAVQAALMVYALVSPGTGTQPVVYTAVAGAIGNVAKLNALFPPGSSAEGEVSAAQKAQGAKNVGRGLLLAVVATFGGCALFYSLPDALASAVGRSLPYWFYESEKLLLALGSAVANWVVTAFFR